MYEDRTQQNILQELLEIVPTDANKQEGSLIYASLSAAATKLEEAYMELGIRYENCFEDTCDREHLIRKGRGRGIEPYPATYPVYKGEFNCPMNIGDRFSLDMYNFTIIEKITDLEYRLKCETPGTEANNCFGELEALTYNKDFEYGRLTELLIPAKDEQSTEDFRKEYYATVASQEFAGNIPAYISKIGKMDGVGYCKPIACKYGAGTVGCVIIDNQYRQPTSELIQDLQNKIDPETDVNNIGKQYGLPEMESYKGKGYGWAPFNHTVIVAGVKNIPINVNMSIQLKEGYAAEKVKPNIEKSIDKYFLDLSESWKDIPNITVRKSYIEAAVLGIDGVLDIISTTINSESTITLNYDEIPIRGEIIIE